MTRNSASTIRQQTASGHQSSTGVVARGRASPGSRKLSPLKHKLTNPKPYKAGRKLNIDDLPDELLVYIFGLLRPGDLLISARVCKRWLTITNDNVIWHRIYDRKIKHKKGEKSIRVPPKPPFGFWKTQCIKRFSTSNTAKVLALLKKKHPFTGLPSNTQKALELAGVKWLLSFIDTSGEELPFAHKDVFYFPMSVTVRWYNLELPPTGSIKKLRVYSGMPLFRDSSGKPTPDSPCQRSLMFEMDFNWSQWTNSHSAAASDEITQAFFLPNNLLVASWKDGGGLGFITCSFHSNQIVERCLHGNSSNTYMSKPQPPMKDDVDTRFGLHSYSCTVELRNNRVTFWSQQFLNLHCRDNDIGAGFACLRLVSPENRGQHSTFTKRLSLPWKTDVFKGILQNLCILDLTLLDERNNPMWCISSPAQVAESSELVSYDYEGDRWNIQHSEIGGNIHLDFVWDPDTEQYFVIGLVVHVALSAINTWFGTRY